VDILATIFEIYNGSNVSHGGGSNLEKQIILIEIEQSNLFNKSHDFNTSNYVVHIDTNLTGRNDKNNESSSESFVSFGKFLTIPLELKADIIVFKDDKLIKEYHYRIDTQVKPIFYFSSTPDIPESIQIIMSNFFQDIRKDKIFLEPELSG